MSVLSLRRRFNQPSGAVSRTRAVTASPDIRVSAHGDGIVILHIPTGRVFVCNSTGSRIWKAILNGSAPDDASQEISREFDVAPSVVREHAHAFVNKLRQQGLLVP